MGIIEVTIWVIGVTNLLTKSARPSKYLFILTVHVMFSDVKDRFNDPRLRKTLQDINFQDLLYADDTLIVARSRKSANDYLNLIQEESA